MSERVIKFRCWSYWNKDHSVLSVGNEADGTYGFMKYPFEINFRDKSIRGSQSENHEYSGYSWDAIMQFTGLLDKNGKEIYEGDIIKYAGSMSVRTKDEADNPMKEISWNDRLSCWNKPAGIISWEIIGNIYENPELLAEEK